jgi:hypothetical protein
MKYRIKYKAAEGMVAFISSIEVFCQISLHLSLLPPHVKLAYIDSTYMLYFYICIS